MPFENGYHPTADSRFRYRSISQGTLKSDDSVSRNVELDDESPHAACMNGYGPGHEQISMFNTFQSTSKDALSTQVQLAGHILHHFNVEEFADCRLFLVHENHRFADTQWLLSSLVLAQSPILRHLLRTSEPARDGKKRLSLKVADRFNAPGGMESGLRVLYGQPAESFTGFGNHIGLEAEAQRSKRLMDEALAFAAAGEVLGIESVVERGLRTASTVLNWDNLERALSFGLERQIHHKYNPSSAETPAYYEVSLHESDSSPSNTIFTPPTSSKESRVEQSNPPGLGVAEFAEYPKKERSFWDLEMRCVGFLVENVGDSWEFDPSARPLADVDRLPVTMESQSPLSKSRLSRIQFGDHPSEMHAKSSDRNNLISSILLSLPFKTLRLMVTSIAPSIVRHVHSIVKERERRRHIVLQSKSVPWAYRLAAREHEWAEVGFTEWVASSHDGEVSLRRRFTGIDRQVTEPSTPK